MIVDRVKVSFTQRNLSNSLNINYFIEDTLLNLLKQKASKI
jgi:hypothetical protein